MTKIEQLFRLWMAGFGVSEEEANKICGNPRVAMSIKAGDAVGILKDVGRVATYGSELHTASQDPMEQLILMCALK